MGKTKDYILRATKNYQDKFDRLVILAPAGTKEKIKAAGAPSVSAFVNAAIIKALADSDGITGGGSES